MIIVFCGHNDIISISFLIILVCADLKSNNKLYALYYKTIAKKNTIFLPCFYACLEINIYVGITFFSQIL